MWQEGQGGGHDECVCALLQDAVLREHTLDLGGSQGRNSVGWAAWSTLLRMTTSFLDMTLRANTDGSTALLPRALSEAGGAIAEVSSSGRRRRTRNTRLDDPRPRQRIISKSLRDTQACAGGRGKSCQVEEGGKVYQGQEGWRGQHRGGWGWRNGAGG